MRFVFALFSLVTAHTLLFAQQSGKELKSMTVRALANEVVVGLMSATLIR